MYYSITQHCIIPANICAGPNTPAGPARLAPFGSPCCSVATGVRRCRWSEPRTRCWMAWISIAWRPGRDLVAGGTGERHWRGECAGIHGEGNGRGEHLQVMQALRLKRLASS